MNMENLPNWVGKWPEEVRRIGEQVQEAQRKKEHVAGPGQLCRLVLCNYVNPTSSCGSVTIFLYDAIFHNTDGTQFDTGNVRVTLNYPQCTLITNQDPTYVSIRSKLGPRSSKAVK